MKNPLKRVYLSGYMNREVPETKDWRDRATTQLYAVEIGTLDPWRGKKQPYYSEDAYKTEPRILLDRDYSDMQRSDVILINLNQYGVERQMIGTLAELGWAWALRKPTVIFADKDEPNLKHPFVQAIATKICHSLDEALDWVEWLTLEDLR